MKKKNTFWIVLVGVLITPLLLNILILQPSIWPVVGGQNAETVWLGFWATYLGAIASFAMVYWTWQTLKQNKEQLNELKRQWDDEHKPKIDILPIYENDYVLIEIRNISKSYAKNIHFSIDPNYIESIPMLLKQDQEFYRTINNCFFSLMPLEKKRFLFFKYPLTQPIDCNNCHSVMGMPYIYPCYQQIFEYFKANPVPISCEMDGKAIPFQINIRNAFLGDVK
ncbi:hypothetical protein [Alistipes finegoldii]|uniref:hypothetical protein n=1 Tax=Alistipes finegoldii TaxID=214856 RepID=UPI0026667A87|nr:hypothetical protein [Alistipes finegoldii]